VPSIFIVVVEDPSHTNPPVGTSPFILLTLTPVTVQLQYMPALNGVVTVGFELVPGVIATITRTGTPLQVKKNSNSTSQSILFVTVKLQGVVH